MTRSSRLSIAGSSLAVLALIASAVAQPPEPPPSRPAGPPPPQHHDPLRRVLDTNGDHELDADEISKAAEAITKLDTNADGRVTRDELFPRPPAGWPGRGPGDRGGEGRPGPQGEFGGPPPGGPGAPPPPPREGEGFRPPAGPDPARFVERAMSFDADGDGKLDRAELGKFAEEMMGRMRPGGEGFRRDQPPRPGPRESGGDLDRPERPRRPDGEGRPERPRRPFGEDDGPAPPRDGDRPAPPQDAEKGEPEA